MHCREILFTPRCSPRARKFPRPVNFSLLRTVAELRGIKVAQFSDFGLFSPYKTPKTYRPVTSIQPRGCIAEWFRFFHVIVEGPGDFGTGDFLRCLIGELGSGDPQTCPNFHLWQIHKECNCTVHQICTKDVWKCAILRTGVLSHQISLPIPPKPHFGRPLNAKPIIQIALHKSHVNGATKVKLYCYISIGKYLGCVKIFC